MGLAENPRMLAFIGQLPEEQLEEAAKRDATVTAADLYQMLLDKWLVNEFERVHPKGAPQGLSIEQRYQGITALALRLWHKIDRTADLAELTDEAARVVSALGPQPMTVHMVAHQLGSGTLLVRDDDGNFSFVHQSVLEWLVARAAAEEAKKDQAAGALSEREISALMADFFCSLAGKEKAVLWANRLLRIGGTHAAKKNALLILKRLDVTPEGPLELAGQDLRGSDFSGRDFVGANLSGADLSNARFIGTQLASANLSRAKLIQADLSRASLQNANLEDADCSGARFLGSNLKGVRLQNSILRDAKLVGASRDDHAFDNCDLTGAAANMPPIIKVRVVAGQSLPEWERATNAVAWSASGDVLASGLGSAIAIIDCLTGRELRRCKGHKDLVTNLRFSLDGCQLASCSRDRTVRLWDVTRGTEVGCLSGHDNTVTAVAFSPDGTQLASSSDDQVVRLWSISALRLIHKIAGRASFTSVTFSRNGRWLAGGSWDKTVSVWEVTTGMRYRLLEGHSGPVTCVAFSLENDYNDYLVTGSSDKTIRVWDVSIHREICSWVGHESPVNSLTFSSDGKFLVSGSDDKTVRLWDIVTRREICSLLGHDGIVHNAVFSPCGKYLASVSSDNTVRLWNVAGRNCVAILGLLPDGWVCFTPNGRYKSGGETAGYFWQVINACQFQLGELDPYVPNLRMADGETILS